MTLSPPAGSERVAVELKTLVDLAAASAGIDLGGAKVRAAQNGQYLSPFKGRGMAFAESRLYQAGDDVRRMDWRVTARTGKAHSKVFQEERERPLFISVDYRPAMAFATRGVFKSVQAAKLAALLAWAGLRQGDRIGGQVFGAEGCQELEPKNGKAALLRFFNALVSPAYAGNGGHSLAGALSRLQHHARPGSRIYLISDFRGLDGEAENYLALLARHCELGLIQVFDPLEGGLPAEGRYRFTDTQRDVLLDAGDSALRQQYRQPFLNRQASLERLSRKLRLTWLACSTLQTPLSALNGWRPRIENH